MQKFEYSSKKVAVLLIGHGSVDREEEIAEFIKRIRHGRPPQQAIVDEVVRRFRSIGGSPLNRIAEDVRLALAKKTRLPVVLAMRMAAPLIDDQLAILKNEGFDTVISLPWAPYSADLYNDAVIRAAQRHAIHVCPIANWSNNSGLHQAFAAEVLAQYLSMDEKQRAESHWLFTAHSLPMRVINMGDSYVEHLRVCMDGILSELCAHGADIRSQSSLAYQSQGMDGGEWLSPSIQSAIQSVALEKKKTIVVTAFGFLADHTEILYDLDIEARAWAHEAALNFVRTPSLNAKESIIATLASLIDEAHIELTTS